jgi:hypothetical protein
VLFLDPFGAIPADPPPQPYIAAGKAEETFAPEAFISASPIKRMDLRRLESPSLARDSDRAQSFNEHLALGAIVDNECIVFAMR